MIVTAERILADAMKPRFQALFPEHLALLDAYISKPGCGRCKTNLLAVLATETGRLTRYYGDDAQFEVELPEVGPAGTDDTGGTGSMEPFIIINCAVHELSDRLNAMPTSQYRICAARSGDQITVILQPF